MKNYIALSLLMFSCAPLIGDNQHSQIAPLFDFVSKHHDALTIYTHRSPNLKGSRITKKSKNSRANHQAAETKAFETVRNAAVEGYVPAQDVLAYCYATGAGTKMNTRLAFSWYLKAALEGSKSALNSLITCFEEGLGVAKDVKIAQILGNILNIQDEMLITKANKINKGQGRSLKGA